MFNNYRRFSSAGFTLIELLVAILILATLTVALVLLFDPIAQLNKAKDAQRKHDLAQIRNAVDAYFNDTGCYPQSVPFGGSWQVGSTTYMQKVPQDPDCGKGGYCYIYQTDINSTCPQWNVLYAHLTQKMTAAQLLDSCPLKTVCDYLNVKYNYCFLSGPVDCTYIKGSPFPTPGWSSPTPAPGLTSTPTPTSTPTSTPTPSSGVDCAPSSYNAVSAGLCNYLGSDPHNKCTIHGGSLTCWSGGGTTSCSGSLCIH
jgi:prepilin-type N-terminal cleavage/methylation domain-containing protein